MRVELELWHLIVLLMSFFGVVAGFGKVLLSQFEQRLDERFVAMTSAQQREQQHLDERFSRLEVEHRGRERELLDLKAMLPQHYVRREDQIREASLLSAKIDSLASKVELLSERMIRGT
jgi:hypothetical protein